MVDTRIIKRQIVEGVVEERKEWRSLEEICRPVSQIPSGDVARAIGELNAEGVLPGKPGPKGYGFGYDHSKAKQNGYV